MYSAAEESANEKVAKRPLFPKTFRFNGQIVQENVEENTEQSQRIQA